MKALFLLLAWAVPAICQAQSFYFGHDLSYANQMEDCGAVFREDGVPADVYRIFAEQGTNLVRVRLWVDPAWQETLPQPAGVKSRYSDEADVKETIARAKAAGMQVMLDLHYSDFWADPARQVIPARWRAVAYDLQALKDSVYHYTARTLTNLDAAGLMPDIVKVGNENNGGMLMHAAMNAHYEPTSTVSTSWTRHAQLFNAAIRAIREVGATASVHPKIALHVAGLDGLRDHFERLLAHGVTDFDLMGFSYYYAWHGRSIPELGASIRDLKARYPAYEVAVVETGYPWSLHNYDALGNLITTPDPAYLPVIPEKQLEYMVDYAREVMRSGGAGVIFWEPAWVSTDCRTPWGQGSSQEHVAFFDPSTTHFMENGGGRWPERRFYDNLDAHKVTFKVNMAGQDVDGRVYLSASFAEELLPMANEGNGIYSYFTYLPEGAAGTYYFLNGDVRESVPPACAEGTERGYTVPDEAVVLGNSWASCQSAEPEPVRVTFGVDMTGQDVSRGVYLTGHVTNWEIARMEAAGAERYTYTTALPPGSAGAYYFLTTPTWDNYQQYRESVPAACAVWWGSDRGYEIPNEDAVFAFRWGTCEAVALATPKETEAALPDLFLLHPAYPNPFRHTTTLAYEVPRATHVMLTVFDGLGRKRAMLVDAPQAAGRYGVPLTPEAWPSGVYFVRLQTPTFSQTRTLTLLK